MLILLAVVLFLIGLSALVLMPFLVGRDFYKQYSGSRVVTCPENHRQVAVSFDAMHAALAQLAGRPSVQLASCTRWPERADCDRGCMPQALRAKAYAQGEIAPGGPSVLHLPVFVAAFAAWVIGAIWHSQYLFRAQWMEAVGLNRSEVHQLVWQIAPHLLTFAAPLLFAYGVAMVLARSGKQGPWIGVAVSICAWAVFAAIILATTGMAGISQDLVKLELGYTVVAAIVIGFIIGEVNSAFGRRHPAH